MEENDEVKLILIIHNKWEKNKAYILYLSMNYI